MNPVESILTFWNKCLKDYISSCVLSKQEKEEMASIQLLLQSDAPFRLWEECQNGFFHEKTIKDVERVDEAIFKLKFRILPLKDEDRELLTKVAVGFESLVVLCICSALRKDGRLIENKDVVLLDS